MSRRRRRVLKALAGFTVAWVLVEAFVLPVLPRHLALGWRTRLPAPMGIIGQRSIQHYPPTDYVLLLGDSYAEGWGDWVTEVDTDSNPAFNACHLVAERTGRDIVNFGRGGADIVSGTAFLVSKRFAALGRTGLGEPAAVVIQFYEGNDLDGCLSDYAGFAGARVEAGSLTHPQRAWEYVRARASEGRRKGWSNTLFFPYMISNSLKGARFDAFQPHPFLRVTDSESAGVDNVLRSGSQLFRLEGHLQAPAPALTEADLEFSFELLDAAFGWVRERFASARIAVLYLPSPAASYELVSPQVRTFGQLGSREVEMDSGVVRARSDRIRARVAEAAARRGMDFLDTTDAIRRAGAAHLVHGPLDGHHFNRAGYEVVAGVLEPWVAAL